MGLVHTKNLKKLKPQRKNAEEANKAFNFSRKKLNKSLQKDRQTNSRHTETVTYLKQRDS